MQKLIDFDKSLTVIYHSDNLWIFIIYGVKKKEGKKGGTKTKNNQFL